MPVYYCEGTYIGYFERPEPKCGWTMDCGEPLDVFLRHVRNKHFLDVGLGYGAVGDRHLCYCNDCPPTTPHADGSFSGLHVYNPEEVLQHLRFHGVHPVEVATWVDQRRIA